MEPPMLVDEITKHFPKRSFHISRGRTLSDSVQQIQGFLLLGGVEHPQRVEDYTPSCRVATDTVQCTIDDSRHKPNLATPGVSILRTIAEVSPAGLGRPKGNNGRPCIGK